MRGYSIIVEIVNLLHTKNEYSNSIRSTIYPENYMKNFLIHISVVL